MKKTLRKETIAAMNSCQRSVKTQAKADQRLLGYQLSG